MLAILTTLVFAGAGLAAIAVIHASVRHHWAQAVTLMRDAGKVGEVREFTVQFITLPERASVAPVQVRRQARRGVSRPVIRPAGGQRAAA